MSGADVLEKTMKVLDFSEVLRGLVWFTNRQPKQPLDEATTVAVPARDWRDMGSPTQVTVTVEPGDLLNDQVAEHPGGSGGGR